mgnify:CR=1 FL=1
MAKPFSVGDYVQWGPPGRPIQRGNIDSIEGVFMDIWIGTFPNPTGGCRALVSVKKVNGRWLAHRPYEGYRDRISRAKYTY